MKNSEVYIPEYDLWYDNEWPGLLEDPVDLWVSSALNAIHTKRSGSALVRRVVASPILTTTERVLYMNLRESAMNPMSEKVDPWMPALVDIPYMSAALGVKVQQTYRLLLVLMSFDLIRKVSSDTYLVNMHGTGLLGDAIDPPLRWQDTGTWKRGNREGYWLIKDATKAIKGWRELVLVGEVTPHNYEEALTRHMVKEFASVR